MKPLHRFKPIYRCIVADPPWPYHSPRAVVGNGGRGGQGGRASKIIQADVSQHYDTMTIDAIKAMPVASLSATTAHLYLWTTNSFMVQAHEIAEEWGFVPKTIITWAKHHKDDLTKPSMKTGYWFRSASEHVVFAVKGKLRLSGPAVSTVFLHSRLPHSIKPDPFYEMIEEQSPGPRLELFARKVRKGWDGWGDQYPEDER